jgi:hypothetical protein
MRPARIDGAATACLDDVAHAAQLDPDATLVLVGNATTLETTSPKGKNRPYIRNLAAQRAVNAKAYLVGRGGQGIDASRIQVRTGTMGASEVENFLVPKDANLDTGLPDTTPVDERQTKPN